MGVCENRPHLLPRSELFASGISLAIPFRRVQTRQSIAVFPQRSGGTSELRRDDAVQNGANQASEAVKGENCRAKRKPTP